MNSSWVIALPKGVSASRNDDGSISVEGWYERLSLRRPTSAMQTACERLSSPGITVRSLTDLLQREGEPGDLSRFIHFLKRLARLGMVHLSVRTDNGPLTTLVPTAPSFDLADSFEPENRYAISRFAYLHRVEDLLVLESPLAAARIVFDDDRLIALIPHLKLPTTAGTICQRCEFLTTETAAALLSLLVAGGVVTRAGEDGTLAEEAYESLRTWEFHDLLFHARSRLGRHDAPLDGTFTWAGTIAPPSAYSQRGDQAAAIELPCADLEQLQQEDEPFARVVERRQSIREYDSAPITDRQLGEFLYRTARVKQHRQSVIELPDGSATVELTTRPYPSAGALYELEFYLAVRRCKELTPGMYHYDPREHRLVPLPTDEQELSALWSTAAFSADIDVQTIQVLIILAARFQRVAWKYSSLAYALVLKHVGVLFESMYLTATAMRLAPCALGYGDSDVFAKAVDSDYYAETSVGEFLLGSRPADMEP